MYTIKGGVSPDAFNDVQTFANHQVESITVNDDRMNYIYMEPSRKYVGAYLIKGAIGGGQLAYMPTNYRLYVLCVEDISMADIEAIAQWQSAEEIKLLLDAKISDDMLDRIHELAKTQNMFVRYTHRASLQQRDDASESAQMFDSYMHAVIRNVSYN